MQKLSRDQREKLNRMTILVGMIGSDGILLAADQCLVTPASSGREFDDRCGVRKIKHIERHKVAYAGVGDDLTWEVGRELERLLDEGTFNFTRLERSLRELAIETIKGETLRLGEIDEDRIRYLLIVFYGEKLPRRQMWRLQIHRLHAGAWPVDRLAIAGTPGNAARYFEFFYKDYTPVSELTFLAAHIVLTAGKWDRTMVDGLDIALFTDAGCRFISDKGKQELRQRSQKLDATLSHDLLTGFIDE